MNLLSDEFRNSMICFREQEKWRKQKYEKRHMTQRLQLYFLKENLLKSLEVYIKTYTYR